MSEIRNRYIPMEGLFNFRELGGYAVEGGKSVKWGLLYRSGELRAMTEADRKIMIARNIRTIVDFRSIEEREYKPDAKLSASTRIEEQPIDAGNLMNMAYTAEGAAAEMEKLYTAMPREAIPCYRRLFQLLRDKKAAPLLFHCTAGKDRTGLAAFLLLRALGAGEETCYADYLESTELLRERNTAMFESQPYMIPYMSVQKSYIEHALAAMEEFGGIDLYLENELGADMDLLRNLYTE